MSFLTVHLPGFVHSCGLPLYVGAGAISMIGLFNIIGSLAAGELSQRWKRRELLVGIFAARAVLMTVFLLAEKTALNVMIFSALMGLLWLSTVPPSLALCARNWGLRWLDTIFYQLFQSFPSIFFELIQFHITEANNYRFDSVEVKQLSFRLDGVFLPQNNHPRFHRKTGVGTGIKLSPHPTLLTDD